MTWEAPGRFDLTRDATTRLWRTQSEQFQEPTTGCSEQSLDDVTVVENRGRAVLQVVDAVFRIDSDSRVNRRGDVSRTEASCDRVGGVFVALADDLSDLCASTGKEDRATGAPVIAAAVGVDLWSPTELGQEHDQR